MSEFSENKSVSEVKETKNDGTIKLEFNTKKVVTVLILTVVVIFSYTLQILEDRMHYKSETLTDNIFNIPALSFKAPVSMQSVGRIGRNSKSIPNMFTLFAAAAYPEKDIEIMYFSDQAESDTGENYKKDKKAKAPDAVKYFMQIIMQMNPEAQNFKIKTSDDNYKKKTKTTIDEESKIFVKLYNDINPTTEKGHAWISDYNREPISIIFSFKENGITYNQLLEGTYVTFSQNIAFTSKNSDPADERVMYILCKDVFSYKAPEVFFKKNKKYYDKFKNSLKVNPDWIKRSNEERRNIISQTEYVTTETLKAGQKFDTDKFKNTMYMIMYLDESSKKVLYDQAKKELELMKQNSQKPVKKP